MKKYFKSIVNRIFDPMWLDIKNGENLNFYLTILIALIIAVLGLFQVVAVEVLISVLLGVLSLLVGFLLNNRKVTFELKDTSNELKKSFDGFTNHFFDTFALSNEMRNSGIRSVDKWPINFLKTANEIDIVLVRSAAWLAIQTTSIEEALKDTGSNIRICLVHPFSSMISAIASKHDEIEQESGARILDSILTLASIGERTRSESAKGRLQIRCHKLIPSYAYYRFDQNAYLLLYGLRRGKIDFPMLLLENGSLMSFFKNDFDSLWAEFDTEQIYDSALGIEDNRASLSVLQISDEKLNRLFKNISRASDASV